MPVGPAWPAPARVALLRAIPVFLLVTSIGRHYLLFQALEGIICCSKLWKTECVVTRLGTAMIALTDLVRAMIALTRSVRAIIALTELVRAVIALTELGTAFWLFQSL